MAPLKLPVNLPSIPPQYVPSKNTTAIILVAAAAATFPVAYLVAVRRSYLKRARICPGKPPAYPTSLPDDVKAASEEGSVNIVLSHERLTSVPVPVNSLRPDLQVEEEGLDVILTPYVRAIMCAWIDTQGGHAVKKALSKLAGADDLMATFSPALINGLEFEEGDIANGIWKVSHRGESADGGERVELSLTTPAGLAEKSRFPNFDSVIVAGWEVLEPESGKEEEEGGVNLVFINETWMWRRTGQSKPMLEFSFGRWWHAAVAGWLMGRGIDAVTVPPKGDKSGSKATPAVVRVVPEKQPLKEGNETETETETETEASGSEDEE